MAASGGSASLVEATADDRDRDRTAYRGGQDGDEPRRRLTTSINAPAPPGTIDADVAVIGAGPGGAATALFSARAGRRVLLIDKQSFPRDKPCGEGLMPSGRRPLRELGLEERVVGLGAPPLNGIQFGLLERPQAAVAFPSHAGERAGLGVRRFDFDRELIAAVEREPSIEFCQRLQAVDIRRHSVRPTVITDHGEIRARYIVVADGLRSTLRHRLGWTVGPRPPHRYGIVAHWQMEEPVDPWVRITFADGLELYEGPVSGNQRMIGLLCYQERMRTFGGQLQSKYRDVARTIRPHLRNAEQVGPVYAVGPFWYRARIIADRDVFLVGDAAGFTDPITGEGIAAALRQARAVAAALESPNPERVYRRAHHRLTANPRRVASLFLRLSRTPALVERGLRSHDRAPQTLPKLLGIGFGYWGFNRITPREWVRLFTGF
jgi:flavin-dependent dehydrogenase